MERRIVSLVPSLTHTLALWGLSSEIVGCTQFCVEPPSLYKSATQVGGTKDFDVEKISRLHPTHILLNKEENPKDRVEFLMAHYPCLLTFPCGPADVPDMLRAMGSFLSCSDRAEKEALELEQLLHDDGGITRIQRSFLYLIWRNPYMAVGTDTYISRLLEAMGWQNSYQGAERYPSLSLEQIEELAPEVILMSSEPFPFKKRHARELRANCPKLDQGSKRIYGIDGRLMSWYGSKTKEAVLALRHSSLLEHSSLFREFDS